MRKRSLVSMMALLLISALTLAPLTIAPAPARADSLSDIVTLAKNTPELSLLAEAVAAAGLDGILGKYGPFTVFAPTNDAFAAALKALNTTKEDLFKNKELLTSILVYHVLPGTLTSKLVVDNAAAMPELATLNMGQPVTISGKDGKYLVNDANITAVDVRAANGIVHIIDKVLVPATQFAEPKLKMDETKSLVEVATAAGSFKTLLAALTATKPVLDYLTNAGYITVFAPTDDAIAGALKVLKMTPEQLLAAPDLARTLAYHVVPFAYPSEWLAKMDGVLVGTVAEDTLLAISVKDNKVMINGSVSVVTPDVKAGSSVLIHAIDGLLLPPAVKADAAATMEMTPEATMSK